MKIVYLEKTEIEKEIAQVFIDEIKKNPSCVLGFATGSSPLGIYKNLIDANKKGEVSFKNVTSFNLDEYIGLNENNDQSYRYYMNNNFFKYIDIDIKNTHVPSAFVKTNEEAQKYDEMIKKMGGIDVQLLGLGSDGHIAFNEPGTSFDSLTHIVDLTEQTIKDNSRFFNRIEDVPTQACTMGLKSIMNAKKVVLIATGKSKKGVIDRLVKGEFSEDLPVSILEKHDNATIYVDKELK